MMVGRELSEEGTKSPEGWKACDEWAITVDRKVDERVYFKLNLSFKKSSKSFTYDKEPFKILNNNFV